MLSDITNSQTQNKESKQATAYMPFYSPTNQDFLQHLSGGSEGEASACNAGDPGSIPGSGSLLEKETAAHLSILAWRIPWTEEPGRLQSMG